MAPIIANRQSRSQTKPWLQRSVFAAAVLASAIAASSAATSADADTATTERSKAVFARTLVLESQTASAIKAKSLADLQKIDADIMSQIQALETLAKSGETVSGCDGGVMALQAIVDVALSRIKMPDISEQIWTLESVQSLLGGYEDMISACAQAAGIARGTPQLTAELLKAQ